MKRCNTENFREWARTLRAGEEILLSGTVYTSRDAAHKRIFKAIADGAPLPYPIEGAFIYYAGPTPAKRGAVGACGPTTSSRMDVYAPKLYDMGLAATIGKGDRSEAVYEAIRKNGGLYLCAIGGAGALAAKCITECEVIAFPELGCESVKRLTLSNFPVFVALDCHGGSLFKE